MFNKINTCFFELILSKLQKNTIKKGDIYHLFSIKYITKNLYLYIKNVTLNLLNINITKL